MPALACERVPETSPNISASTRPDPREARVLESMLRLNAAQSRVVSPYLESLLPAEGVYPVGVLIEGCAWSIQQVYQILPDPVRFCAAITRLLRNQESEIVGQALKAMLPQARQDIATRTLVGASLTAEPLLDVVHSTCMAAPEVLTVDLMRKLVSKSTILPSDEMQLSGLYSALLTRRPDLFCDDALPGWKELMSSQDLADTWMLGRPAVRAVIEREYGLNTLIRNLRSPLNLPSLLTYRALVNAVGVEGIDALEEAVDAQLPPSFHEVAGQALARLTVQAGVAPSAIEMRP